MTLSTVTIRDACGLIALEPRWRELWSADPRSTPFQSPEWLLPWWKAFGSGELFTVAVSEGTDLVGLAPMFIHPWKRRRQVTLIGNGLSDRLRFLTRPGRERIVIQQILDVLSANRDRWDVCDFQDLSAEDPLLDNAMPHGLMCFPENLYPNLAIALPADRPSYEASLSSSVRRNLRRYVRQFAAEGELAFEIAATLTCFERTFDALLRFHKQRRSHQGSFEGQEEEFHRATSRAQYDSGSVRLHSLTCGGTVAAVVYIVVHRNRAYACMAGFDGRWSKFRPGWLVLHHAIENAIDEGLEYFDFLRGDEEFKRLFGAQPYTTRRIIIESA